MTRSFTSSDPVAIADYLQAKAVSGTDTQADTIEAMRASLEQALVANNDLRDELAAERLRADKAEAAAVQALENEQRWVVIIQALEARLQSVREVVR